MIMYVYFVIYEYIQFSGIQKHHELLKKARKKHIVPFDSNSNTYYTDLLQINYFKNKNYPQLRRHFLSAYAIERFTASIKYIDQTLAGTI